MIAVTMLSSSVKWTR